MRLSICEQNGCVQTIVGKSARLEIDTSEDLTSVLWAAQPFSDNKETTSISTEPDVEVKVNIAKAA